MNSQHSNKKIYAQDLDELIAKRTAEKLIPRPTEYAGVRFKSKSEAVFARSLDLAGIKWLYEPFAQIQNPPGGHSWDFLLFATAIKAGMATWNEHKFHVPGATFYESDSWFVEFKPARPNDTYLLELGERTFGSEGGSYLGNFAVIYGSPWESTAYRAFPLLFRAKPCWFEDPSAAGVLRFIAQETSYASAKAMQYRFDIAKETRSPSVVYWRDQIEASL
jgi:hypothetical protein